MMRDGSFHIDKEQLKSVLSNSEIFTVDKIRSLQNLYVSACTMHECDPFKIFLNVGLLIEMKDREKEEVALVTKPIIDWPSLLTNPTFWTDATSTQLNTAHVNADFNSLVFTAQISGFVTESEVAGEGTGDVRAGRKRKTPDHGGSSKVLKAEAPVPSSMTVTQKNTLMLTVLLVHHAEHLLFHGLSAVRTLGSTRKMKFRPDDPAHFTDLGHLMERHLYGYSLQHVCNELWPTAFAVDDVLGSVQQEHPTPLIVPCLPSKQPAQSAEVTSDSEDDFVDDEERMLWQNVQWGPTLDISHMTVNAATDVGVLKEYVSSIV